MEARQAKKQENVLIISKVWSVLQYKAQNTIVTFQTSPAHQVQQDSGTALQSQAFESLIRVTPG